MTAGLRFFFRHIYVTGLENIPLKGPAIIIANHNSSLMDAALLGILLKRKAFFFARGDVFVNKPVQKILWWLQMMPVHGHQGGRQTLQANQNSFLDGQKILLKGGLLVFFPESNSHIEHQLLPFRKGVFRLAFDAAAASNFAVEIPIVPIGITYDHPVNSRQTVQVHAGKPLLLSHYTAAYQHNSAAAILHICKDAYQKLKTLTLHIADKTRLPTALQCFVINRNDNPVKTNSWKIASALKLAREQGICASINNDTALEAEFKQKQLEAYTRHLTDAGITDKTVSKNFYFPAWKRIMLWCGFPFYVAGLVLNGPPVLIARRIGDTKVYRKDFYSWIFVASYAILYFLWLSVLVLIAARYSWLYALYLAGLMFTTGIFAYLYTDWLYDSRQEQALKLLNPSIKQELQVARQACKKFSTASV